MKRLRNAAIIFQIIGYGMLLWQNWLIAIAVFIVHWSINCESTYRLGK
jgi:hypothetical protein